MSYFLFMDESFYGDGPRRYIAITGLLVPTASYSLVRNEMHALVRGCLGIQERQVGWAVPELHFRELLPRQDDKVKLEILEGVVSLIVGKGVAVYRTGFIPSTPIPKPFSIETFSGFCFLDIVASLRGVLENNPIIPVFDAGFEKSFMSTVTQVSGSVWYADLMRCAGLEASITIPFSYNLAEPVYADSQFSAFIQMTDLVAGLLGVTDRAASGGENRLSEFKASQNRIAQSLKPALALNQLSPLRFETAGNS